MNLKMALNFENIYTYMGNPNNSAFSFTITNVKSASNCEYEAVEQFNEFRLSIDPVGYEVDCAIYLNGVLVEHFIDFSEIERIVTDPNEDFIIEGDISTTETELLNLINNDLLFLDIEGLTSIFLYKQNSANNVLTKSLTFVTVIQGKFNIPVGLKTFALDLTSVSFFNYVWIPAFNRYYYVNNVQLVAKDLVRYSLGEDVLMSWKSLIKSQSAFVTRQQNASPLNNIVDTRLPQEDTKTETLYTITDLGSGGFKNITFDYDTTGFRFMAISFTTSNNYVMTWQDTNAPAGSGLPKMKPRSHDKTVISLLPYASLYALIRGIYGDSSKASYIEKVMWLPFNPVSVLPHLTQANSKIYANDKALEDINFTWVNPTDISQSFAPCYNVQVCQSPYLILNDFWFNNNGGITNVVTANDVLFASSQWEIYVPFVGWVQVEFNKVANNRILIYYTMDFKTGIATAFIYNFTRKFVVWSGTCQIGVLIDITTSNQLENTRQKQANDLNMAIGLISSALSIGVGVATENPVAVAGGVLSAGKVIASNVNANKMLFERAQTTFGTSDTALYLPTEVKVRRTYHAVIGSGYSATFLRLQGRPYNAYTSLSALTGYTEVGDIQFNPSNAEINQDEINEIVALLKNGVIL